MGLLDIDRKSLVRHRAFKFKRCVKKRTQLYTVVGILKFAISQQFLTAVVMTPSGMTAINTVYLDIFQRQLQYSVPNFVRETSNF